jgi:hypothetical protein
MGVERLDLGIADARNAREAEIMLEDILGKSGHSRLLQTRSQRRSARERSGGNQI